MDDSSNPYQAPVGSAAESASEQSAERKSEQQPIVRRGLVPVLGVLWNLPLLLLTLLMFRGQISEGQVDFLMVCWGGTLPFVCMTAAWSPFIQRLVFLPNVDVQRVRPGLLGVAALWTILTIVGLYLTWP